MAVLDSHIKHSHFVGKTTKFLILPEMVREYKHLSLNGQSSRSC